MSDTNKVVRGVKPEHTDCQAVTQTLARIGDKWTVMVIGTLAGGPLRYNELRRAVSGISQRMLTLTLKGLEQDGLVNRTVYPTVPPRVDYELTELGQTLAFPLRAIYDWATKHRVEVEAARKRYAEGRPAKNVKPVQLAALKPATRAPEAGRGQKR